MNCWTVPLQVMVLFELNKNYFTIFSICWFSRPIYCEFALKFCIPWFFFNFAINRKFIFYSFFFLFSFTVAQNFDKLIRTDDYAVCNPQQPRLVPSYFFAIFHMLHCQRYLCFSLWQHDGVFDRRQRNGNDRHGTDRSHFIFDVWNFLQFEVPFLFIIKNLQKKSVNGNNISCFFRFQDLEMVHSGFQTSFDILLHERGSRHCSLVPNRRHR